MKLVLAGGGTGGHIYPGLALAESFADEPAFAPLDVLFVGTRDRLEARIVPAAGVPIAYVRAAPLARSLSPSLVRTAVLNAVGFVQALAVLRRAKPDVLIATGGYVALPVVAALRALRSIGVSRAKIALFEANAVAGVTNRLLAPLVDETWYAIPPRRPLRARERVVGMPVRSSMRRDADAGDARRAFGLAPDVPTVVAMGGSQGAASINDALAAAAPALAPPAWQLVAISGERDHDALRTRFAGRAGVVVVPYLDDPRDAFAAADVVVARAGASTLGELAATGTPALLVPYPFATADHQRHNAEAYAASGAARVLADRELSGERLRAELDAMLATDALARLRAAARARASVDPRTTIAARVKHLLASNSALP